MKLTSKKISIEALPVWKRTNLQALSVNGSKIGRHLNFSLAGEPRHIKHKGYKDKKGYLYLVIIMSDEYPENLPELLKDENFEFIKTYHPTNLSKNQMVVTVPKKARDKIGISFGTDGGRLACFVNEKEGLLIYIRVDKYGKPIIPKKSKKQKKGQN